MNADDEDFGNVSAIRCDCVKSAAAYMFALLMCLTCSILGLRRDCTDDDVRKYYRRQAVLVHPDKVHVFMACYPLPPTHTHTPV